MSILRTGIEPDPAKPASSVFVPELGKPIRFLAVRWSEDWEFDYPSVLLEPVVRYSSSGMPNDELIEEAAIDIAIAIDEGCVIYHEDFSREFEFRRWNLKTLKLCANESLKGKRFPVKGYVAEEQWIVFRKNEDGETDFEVVDRPL